MCLTLNVGRLTVATTRGASKKYKKNSGRGINFLQVVPGELPEHLTRVERTVEAETRPSPLSLLQHKKKKNEAWKKLKWKENPNVETWKAKDSWENPFELYIRKEINRRNAWNHGQYAFRLSTAK